MAKDESRIETPLLREYVKRLPKTARYMPHIPGWIPWVAFFALDGILERFVMSEIAFVGAILVAWSIPNLIRLPYRPKSDEERAEQEFLDSVRKLRSLAHEGSLRKKLPNPVLMALERCAGARIAALARLATADPVEQAVESEAIEGCMRAAIVSVLPVVRADDLGRREWDAICENQAVMGAMVDAIQTLEDRMSRPSTILTERLVALRELEEVQLATDVPTSI